MINQENNCQTNEVLQDVLFIKLVHCNMTNNTRNINLFKTNQPQHIQKWFKVRTTEQITHTNEGEGNTVNIKQGSRQRVTSIW